MYLYVIIFEVVLNELFLKSVFVLPLKVFVTHYSSKKSSGRSFKKLCEICAKSDEFADDLLNHATIDIDVYSEFLSLTAPVVTSEKKQFKENCSTLKISDLMNVTEEAFALLVMENCFKHWKFLAEARLGSFHRKKNLQLKRAANAVECTSPSSSCENSSSSSSSTSCSIVTQQDDVSRVTANPANANRCNVRDENQISDNNTGVPSDNEGESLGEDVDGDDCSEVSPGYLYQYNQLRTKDNKICFGHWTQRGMSRFNEIVTKVIAERKVRSKFEEHLRLHYKEQVNQSPLTLKRKRKNKGCDDDSDEMKVVVIDLFSDGV